MRNTLAAAAVRPNLNPADVDAIKLKAIELYKKHVRRLQKGY